MKIRLKKEGGSWTKYMVTNYKPPQRFKTFFHKGWEVRCDGQYNRGVTLGAHCKIIVLSPIAEDGGSRVNTTDKQAFEEINEAIKLAYKQ
jgi:hypothetical protein